MELDSFSIENKSEALSQLKICSISILFIALYHFVSILQFDTDSKLLVNGIWYKLIAYSPFLFLVIMVLSSLILLIKNRVLSIMQLFIYIYIFLTSAYVKYFLGLPSNVMLAVITLFLSARVVYITFRYHVFMKKYEK